jgi:uncharacterized membrane protein YecN with MAPEG domain
MNLLLPISAATAMVMALFYVKLAFGVIKKRQLHRVALGAGQHADLEAAIRAHGNFAEYVPLALLLLVVAEVNHSPWWLVGAAALSLVTGRIIHASAITDSDLKRRVLGMKLTFGSLALGIVANAAPFIMALINTPKT